jgi:aldehyde dehydrogenase (NAD+)
MTSSTVASTPSRDPSAEARRIFEVQTANRWQMAATSAAERKDRLVRLRTALRQKREELCAAIHGDFGKHAVEAELTEFLPVVEELSLAIRDLKSWMRPRRASTPLTLLGSRSEVRYEPKGVVLVLAPWNYPFQLAINPVIAAIAAGNCVMLRPSDKTPRTGRFLKELLGSVFSESEAAVLLGDRALADALLDLPFDHVFFTGSPKTGRKVMACAARHLAPVTLELGGKSPVVVDETASLEASAERIAWGKFINAGQTCVAPDYVLVHESVAERFTAAMGAAVERFYGSTEEARLRSGDFACIVDVSSCHRLEGAVRDSIGAGARLVIGGSVDAAARRMSPTVLSHVPADSAIMADEIFGPVLPILSYRTLDDAIAAIRSRSKPLALYVFSRSRANVEKVLRSTTAGGSCVNNAVVHLANPHIPFGGVGESGMGHYHGRWGFEAMSHARAVLHQTLSPSNKLLFPPYTSRSSWIMSWIRRIAG